MTKRLIVSMLCMISVVIMTSCTNEKQTKQYKEVAVNETTESAVESEKKNVETEAGTEQPDSIKDDTEVENASEDNADKAKEKTKESSGGLVKKNGEGSSNTTSSASTTTSTTSTTSGSTQTTPTPQYNHTHNWMPHWATRVVKDAYDEQVTKTIQEEELHWFSNADPTRDITAEWKNDPTKGNMTLDEWARWNDCAGHHTDTVLVEKTVTVTEHHDAVTEQYIDYYFCADDSCKETHTPAELGKPEK